MKGYPTEIGAGPGGLTAKREGRGITAVIGAGPGGLAAARAAWEEGADVVLIERESRPGGILKQCIHDGFGLIRYRERLTGPEYAAREVERLTAAEIPLLLDTFVLSIEFMELATREEAGHRVELAAGQGVKWESWAERGVNQAAVQGAFHLILSNRERGIFSLHADSLVLAAGCRERTDRQIFLHGSRPSGIFTAGLAQYFINIQGYLPAKRCVILGSGDIGLIMARRLTLEGAEVEGVYEIKPQPSGLARNIHQCLEDFDIPLHLSTTVTEVHGRGRVESVTVADVDDRGKPIEGSKREVFCDALILSVGLIPENDAALPMGLELDKATGGPRVNQYMMTNLPGLFSCGNALHVNDLVDYVSESGDRAGLYAARWVADKRRSTDEAEGAPVAGDALPVAGTIPPASRAKRRISVERGDKFLYAVPQVIDLPVDVRPLREGAFPLYFRSSCEMEDVRLSLEILVNGEWRAIAGRKYTALKPPEMEQLMVPTGKIPPETERIRLSLEAAGE